MISKRKKIIIMSTMVALLLLTGYLNITLNNNLTQSVSATETVIESFYINYRTVREESRLEQIEIYNSIIESSASSSESITAAENSKLEIISAMETEVVIEGLIKAKGFSDCIYTQSGDNVIIVIDSGELTSSEVSQICEIIIEQTGLSIENITIIPSKAS